MVTAAPLATSHSKRGVTRGRSAQHQKNLISATCDCCSLSYLPQLKGKWQEAVVPNIRTSASLSSLPQLKGDDVRQHRPTSEQSVSGHVSVLLPQLPAVDKGRIARGNSYNLFPATWLCCSLSYLPQLKGKWHEVPVPNNLFPATCLMLLSQLPANLSCELYNYTKLNIAKWRWE